MPEVPKRLLVLPLLLAIVALSAVVGHSNAATARSVSIVGTSTASNGVVTVTVKLTGWKLYPGLVGKKANKPDGGHWHIYVDGRYDNLSASPTKGKTKALTPGAHAIRVELANNNHSSLKPRVVSRVVRVVISSPPTPPPPTTTPEPTVPPPLY